MEMKNMVVGLLLIAAFALPALATSFEKDFITHEAVQKFLEKVGSNSNGMIDEKSIKALTGKTIISKQLFEEAFLKDLNSIENLGGSSFTEYCNETCRILACVPWCQCYARLCYTNSLA